MKNVKIEDNSEKKHQKLWADANRSMKKQTVGFKGSRQQRQKQQQQQQKRSIQKLGRDWYRELSEGRNKK